LGGGWAGAAAAPTASAAWPLALLAFTLLLLQRRTPLRPCVGPRRFSLARGLLLEFLHLPLHELARRRLLARAQLVVAAVRAALPAFGKRFLAGGAEDALGQRHAAFSVYPEPRRRRGISGGIRRLQPERGLGSIDDCSDTTGDVSLCSA